MGSKFLHSVCGSPTSNLVAVTVAFAYAVGMVSSDVLAGVLMSRTSFLVALLLTALIMLASLIILSLVRPLPGMIDANPTGDVP